jgi:hypothetical protein
MDSVHVQSMLPRWLHHKVEACLEHFLRPIGSEEEDFLEPRGEPALLPPDSVSWKIFKNPLGLYIGGIAAWCCNWPSLAWAAAFGNTRPFGNTRSSDCSVPDTPR